MRVGSAILVWDLQISCVHAAAATAAAATAIARGARSQLAWLCHGEGLLVFWFRAAVVTFFIGPTTRHPLLLAHSTGPELVCRAAMALNHAWCNCASARIKHTQIGTCTCSNLLHACCVSPGVVLGCGPAREQHTAACAVHAWLPNCLACCQAVPFAQETARKQGIQPTGQQLPSGSAACNVW